MHKLLLRYLLLRAGRSRGNPSLPLKMSAWCLPDGITQSRRPPRNNCAGNYYPPRNDVWDGMVAAVQEDPGVPMISCSIYIKHFERCLCDLGASVNVMPKVIYEALEYLALSPTTMLIQLADSTIRYPEGIPNTFSHEYETPSFLPTSW